MTAVKNLILPLKYTKKDGPDVCIWSQSGAGHDDLESLIENTEASTYDAVADRSVLQAEQEWREKKLEQELALPFEDEAEQQTAEPIESNELAISKQSSNSAISHDSAKKTQANESSKKLSDKKNTENDQQRISWSVIDYTQMQTDDSRGAEVIEGVVREGEVALIVASSKDGKTWLAHMLACCFAMGIHFFGLAVRQGRVLIIDNELKLREIYYRLSCIMSELQYSPALGDIEVVSLRGQSADIVVIVAEVLKMNLVGVTAIIIDCLYKIIPGGQSENDNPAMGQLMNLLQFLSDSTNIPIFAVHHATKGDQSQKRTLDMAAGAGSFGRSLDALMVIRDHETDGHSVIEFKSRTNKSAEPISIKFDWPLWHATTLEPKVRKPVRQNIDDQKEADKKDLEYILSLIPTLPERIQHKDLKASVDAGCGRFDRLIGKLIKSNLIERLKETVGKRECVFFRKFESSSESSSGSGSD